eukprot:403338477
MEFRKDQPSVKLHQAPGGQSTFSFGWGVEEKQEQPRNKTQATVQPQVQEEPQVKVRNQQESSISFGQEEEKKENAAVKIVQAPGGQSSFSFGWGNDDASSGTQVRNKGRAQVNNNQDNVAAGWNASSGSTGDDSNGVKSSTRVHNPPGGRSQIQF